MSAQFECRDGGLAGSGGGKHQNGNFGGAGAQVPESVQHRCGRETGAENDGVKIRRLKQGGVELRGRGGGKIEVWGVPPNERGQGGLLGRRRLDEEDLMGRDGGPGSVDGDGRER